jgi:hypothetical protein
MHNEQIKDAYEIACLMESRRLCNDLLSALLRFRTTSSQNFVGKIFMINQPLLEKQ